jgi:bifunctional ADP-heptose synthase (sugar kinase/adenylyltransferase)
MGFIVGDVGDTCKLIATQLRRSGDGEGERDGGGLSHLGTDKNEHNNNQPAGQGRKESLRAMAKEGRGAEAVRGKPKVAVFGDRMTDFYYLGKSDKLSAEVPIPVVKVFDRLSFPGGAGNVVANLKALGVEVIDTTRKWESSAKYDYYPVKNRLMVGDHQVARWDEWDSCEPWDGKVLPEVDAIVVADYGKGAITADIIAKIKAFGGPIFVDTKGDPSVWSGVATAIFPNIKESTQFKEAYQQFDGLVVEKLGPLGISIYNKTQICQSPSQARFIRSVNGAGDSVIAAFVYKYLVDKPNHQQWPIYDVEGNFWQNCLDFANAAAAIAVEHPWTYAPTIKEVEERYYAFGS